MHTPDLLAKVERASAALSAGETSYTLAVDNYENMHTFMAAKKASQACIDAVEAVISDEESRYDAGYCIVRPPGHHAHSEDIQGFCFFNNVAIAAQYAVDKGKKVLIFDWDIHHGDGTQDIFYDSDQVLYMSLHRYDNMTFFPRREDSQVSYIGRDRGAGFNVNVAWQTGIVAKPTFQAVEGQEENDDREE